MAGNIKQIKTSDGVIHDLEVDLTNYYDKSEVDAIALTKADADNVYTKAEVTLALADKADANNVYTKAETDIIFNSKADANTVYTKGETDNLLSAKANVHDVYDKTEVNGLLGDKADKADTYTKAEVDGLVGAKADSANVYTKTEADALLGAKADSADVYTKTEADANFIPILGSVSVTSEAGETYGSVLNRLGALVDFSKIRSESYLKLTGYTYKLLGTDGTSYVTFTAIWIDGSAHQQLRRYTVSSNSSFATGTDGNNTINTTQVVSASDQIEFKVVY